MTNPGRIKFFTGFVIFLAAFFIRSIHFSDIFSSSGVMFTDPDSLYHLRRILLMLNDFPSFTVIDKYTGFPEGIVCNLPYGFDFIIALFSWIIGFGSPSRELVEVLSAFVSPLLGALSSIIVYEFSFLISGMRLAVFSSLIFIFLPANADFSLLGRVDHHALEGVIPALMFLLYVKSLNSGGLLLKIAAGLAIASPVFLYPSSGLTLILFFLALIIAEAISIIKKKDDNETIRNYQIFISAFISAIPFSLFSPYGRLGIATTLAPSAFHILLVCILTAVLFSIPVIHKNLVLSRTLPIKISAIAALVSTSLIFLYLFPKHGLDFVGQEGYYGLIEELETIFELPHDAVFKIFSCLILLFPFAAAVFFLKGLKEGRFEKSKVYFGLYVLFSAALAMLQYRFIVIFSVPYSIITGYLLAFIFERLRKKLYRGILILLTFVSLIPSLVYLKNVKMPSGEDLIYYKELKYLKTHAPPTSYLFEPDKDPEYGVLAGWDLGDAINYIAEKPNIGNNLIYPPMFEGVQRTIDLLMSTEPEKAYARMKELSIRYVIVRPMPYWIVRKYASLTNFRITDFFDFDKETKKQIIKGLYYEILNNRLLFSREKKYGNFRLVRESPEKTEIYGNIASIIRIFEIE